MPAPLPAESHGIPDGWGAAGHKMAYHPAPAVQHCIELHRLDPDDSERGAWFNLIEFTLTLGK